MFEIIAALAASYSVIGIALCVLVLLFNPSEEKASDRVLLAFFFWLAGGYYGLRMIYFKENKMKVKDVIRDLGSEVRVQLYKATESGYDHLFLRAYYASILRRGHIDGKPWISVNMDKEVDHCSYSTVTKGDGFETFCDIYLKAEPTVVETESELTAFFKKLDPDTYVNIRVWYGDPKDDAGEFILIGLSGADYRPASCCFNYINDLFEHLKILKISYISYKGIFLDCTKKED